MKTNLEENMEQILDLDPSEKPMVEIIKEESTSEVTKYEPLDDDLLDDYTYARKNLRDVIEGAMSSVQELASIASVSESPRAYEVLSTTMKTIVDANKDLLNLQKQIKDIKDEPRQDVPQNVTNAMFVGSTADLLKALKDQ